ncbi:MAG: DUF2975 domain-containing protein [Clostridiales bacterium]|nr:DUF2975 domain-containing protein [Clostridiales bacterium]
MKQSELAKWLKCIIIISAFIGLFLCGLIAPLLGSDAASANPELKFMLWPSLIFIWITAVPLYMALWESWLISCDISNDNSFCDQNAKRLKSISKLALCECIFYLAAIITLMALNMLHPGILLIAVLIIFISISISVTSAALSHLVEKASALKQENDLTI